MDLQAQANLLFDTANDMMIDQVRRHRESEKSNADFQMDPVEHQTRNTIQAMREAGHQMLTLAHM
jgi:hypothetical protein